MIYGHLSGKFRPLYGRGRRSAMSRTGGGVAGFSSNALVV